MDAGANAKTERIRVVISNDRLRAWLELPKRDLVRSSLPAEAGMLAALDESGIEISDAVRARVAQYAQLVREGMVGHSESGPPEVPERFLIAEGLSPVDATHGDFEWDEIFNRSAQDWRGDASMDYYTANSILTVEADTVVGRIRPPVPGSDGRDVFGEVIPPKHKVGLPVKMGEGLCMAENDPLQVVTRVAGRLIRERQTLRVSKLLDIRGDVDFKSGSIDSVIDVHVAGNVKPRFAVKTSKSLTIWGSVEAARLTVGGDVQVRGGLFGQESGCRIEAGGVVVASICDGVDVEAGGDVRVTRELINSQLRTAGRLLIERGSIIGGEVYARNGVRARQLGSSAGVPTRIAVGVDGAILYRARKIAERIEKRLQRAGRIRAQLRALNADRAGPTAAQRAQSAELLAKASEEDRAAAELAAKRDEVLSQAAPATTTTIEVEGVLHAGVVLVFGLHEATIGTPLKGPLRVEERRAGHNSEIVLVWPATGRVVFLPSDAVDAERFEGDR
jgi:uncharacterized protein (DUF342 family)